MILKVRGNPALGEAMNRAAREWVRAAKRERPGIAREWREELARRPLGMRLREFVELTILHRQFSGKLTPLLPTFVRVARFVATRAPRRREPS